MKSFENEGVQFSDVFIDRSFISDNSPMRKPGTGMLTDYINDSAYDVQNSFVIGDRITDMELAKNLGCKGLWLNNDKELGASEIIISQSLKEAIALETQEWQAVYKFLKDQG
jgi:imidazoleglycerol-phosphate dehydratase/histidinol-phosphatase